MRNLAGKSYGVFHVERADGRPYIPAQDFVRRYGIRSVVGFGGSLANTDLFAVIAFSKVEINESAADRFRTVALDLKGSLFGYDELETFDRS